jgi:gas vesicle protein
MDERTIIVRQGSVGSFLRGIAVGAALALLLAPRSGRETRDIITEKGYEIKDKAYEVKDKAVDVAKNTRDRAQTMVVDARDKFGASVKSASQSIGMGQGEDKDKEQLKRELAISEEFENREFPL